MGSSAAIARDLARRVVVERAQAHDAILPEDPERLGCAIR
jgi:hypothetical protein